MDVDLHLNNTYENGSPIDPLLIRDSNVNIFTTLENSANFGVFESGLQGQTINRDRPRLSRITAPEIIGKSNQSGCFVFQTVINSVPGPL